MRFVAIMVFCLVQRVVMHQERCLSLLLTSSALNNQISAFSSCPDCVAQHEHTYSLMIKILRLAVVPGV